MELSAVLHQTSCSFAGNCGAKLKWSRETADSTFSETQDEDHRLWGWLGLRNAIEYQYEKWIKNMVIVKKWRMDQVFLFFLCFFFLEVFVSEISVQLITDAEEN